jgi:hypothetical protein
MHGSGHDLKSGSRRNVIRFTIDWNVSEYLRGLRCRVVIYSILGISLVSLSIGICMPFFEIVISHQPG